MAAVSLGVAPTAASAAAAAASAADFDMSI